MAQKSYDQLIALKMTQLAKEEEQCTFHPAVNRNSLPEHKLPALPAATPFDSLYQDAEDKKHKTRLLEEQTLKEARDAANRSKIDLNSQKLILKKKERALRALLLKCLDHEDSDTLAAKGVMDFLTEIGLFKNEDQEQPSKAQSFTEKRYPQIPSIIHLSQSVQRLMAEQTIFNELWKLLTLQNESATSVPASFLFDLAIILLENQLTLPQAIDLVLDQIKAQLRKFIVLEHQTQEDKQVDNECLDECVYNLRPAVQAFVTDFRTLYEPRKHLVERALGLKTDKSDKKQDQQEYFSFKPSICEKSKEIIAKNSLGSTIVETRYEQLFEHSKYLAQKRKSQMEEMQQKRMEEPGCSFKPKINEQKQVYLQKEENPHQRLYQFAQKITEHKEQLKEYYQSKREQSEMEQCTFKPQTTMLRPKQQFKVKGEEQVVERLMKARKMKENKENYYITKEMQFSKHDSSKLTQPQPFNLGSRSSNGSNITNGENKKIFLYVDVRISKNRKGSIMGWMWKYGLVRIGLKEGDDPHEVAENFGKIHQLNCELKETLEETLREYMEYFDQQEDDDEPINQSRK